MSGHTKSFAGARHERLQGTARTRLDWHAMMLLAMYLQMICCQVSSLEHAHGCATVSDTAAATWTYPLKL